MSGWNIWSNIWFNCWFTLYPRESCRYLTFCLPVVSFSWLVDQDDIKWFHHSWLPWSLDTGHQIIVNDACCVGWSELRKRRSSCSCSKLLWQLLLICVRQISQEWSQEKRGVSSSTLLLPYLFTKWLCYSDLSVNMVYVVFRFCQLLLQLVCLWLLVLLLVVSCSVWKRWVLKLVKLLFFKETVVLAYSSVRKKIFWNQTVN